MVLASRSPRRAELLRSLGLDFEIRTGSCEEQWRADESPEAYAKRTAREKLEACPRAPGEIRLAADTVVWIRADAPPLEKPADRDEARRMLRRLQEAHRHRVTTSFALDADADADATGESRPPLVHAITTKVDFRSLTEDELEAYLDLDEWRDKAGGYGIQASAASFIPRIEGSYTNVVGLPLAEVVVLLRSVGILPHQGRRSIHAADEKAGPT